MLLVLVLLALFVGYSLAEYILHLRNLNRIGVRVQVNGTRGKSSVTRLIAAGLRAGGMRVVAKTTGTRPRFILDDKLELAVRRLGKPNIAEQLRIVRLARSRKAQALVVENMSLDPQYQQVENKLLVRPTHSVITNVRADHLDVMGPTVADVARFFRRSLPKQSRLFTAEKRYLNQLLRSGDEPVVAEPESVAEAEMQGFGYVEHKENVALALAVCASCGVERTQALDGMKRCLPDPGALRIHQLQAGGKGFELVNGLAANDPDSIGMLWEIVKERSRLRTVLVNCRKDRVDRSRQMAELVRSFDAMRYVATGGLTQVFVRKALELGIPGARLFDLGGDLDPGLVFERLAELVEDSGLVFACGNTVGYGEELVRGFVQRGSVSGH